ncbi:glycosyltransferase [Pelagicoccus albus]|uniref:Glucuronosyltransferase n=1 Tax=Pelagicoccus albus TaxID=415222 RepID=A0A7X1EAF6_9BACT|nr:glycosyltransferase [Pelagicoccus albus]MBC2608238.1 glucuronosyltransferase [Pelagicoccus albus]
MLLITVGTDRPFDRFIEAMDTWAAQNKEVECFAQIGRTNYEPKHIPYCRFLDSDAFDRKLERSKLVVAHAGMGTVLKARALALPMIVFPRSPEYGEASNSHQIDTAQALASLGIASVAFDVDELFSRLSCRDSFLKPPSNATVDTNFVKSLRGILTESRPTI